jgi:PhoH-like ATPase
MARKTFVLDTNVLLYDPNAPGKFGDHDVVFTGPVLEDLDALKKNMDELGRNARSVLRLIDASSLKQDGELSVHTEDASRPRIRVVLDYHPTERARFPLSLDRPFHRTLATAVLLKERGEQVVVVSKDIVNRVKAQSLGLDAEDYENLKVAYDKMFRGIRALSLPREQIDLFLKDGRIPFPGLSEPDLELYPNEYFMLEAEGEAMALARYVPADNTLIALQKLPRDIWGIQPLNAEQRCALDILLRDDVQLVTLIGQAGTGKTLLAIACALRKVFDEQTYTRILVSRPIIPLGKDIGYLPGSKEEKLSHWMQPIYDNLEFLCQSNGAGASGSDTVNWLLESKKIEMEAVTYIRGRTLPKMFIIIDEAQNLTPHEVKTIISRAGKGTKVILTGDPTQIDNPYLDKDSNGLTLTVSRFRQYPIFGHIFLDKTERSELAALAAEVF